MVLEYKINEQDFLDFQIFAASKSDSINKKKRNGWLLLTIGSLGIAVYFYLRENMFLAIYFGLMALVCGLFYPTYFRWRYRRHFKTYLKEHYSKRFGQVEWLEIGSDSIITKNKTGEAKIKLSEIEYIDETDKHFFLKISTGLSLIIPKKELSDATELKSKFRNLGLNVNEEVGWKWK